MKSVIGLLCLSVFLASAPAMAQKTVTRYLGASCGETNETLYECASDLACKRGTCGLKSAISDSDRKCIAAMAGLGYDQKNILNMPAIHDGYCYISRDTPGMYSALEPYVFSGSFKDYLLSKWIDSNPGGSEAEIAELKKTYNVDELPYVTFFNVFPSPKEIKLFTREGKLLLSIDDGKLKVVAEAEGLEYIAEYYEFKTLENELRSQFAQRAADICTAHKKSCIPLDRIP
ncbi:hypothetical protein [Pseudomonas putida]